MNNVVLFSQYLMLCVPLSESDNAKTVVLPASGLLADTASWFSQMTSAAGQMPATRRAQLIFTGPNTPAPEPAAPLDKSAGK